MLRPALLFLHDLLLKLLGWALWLVVQVLEVVLKALIFVLSHALTHVKGFLTEAAYKLRLGKVSEPPPEELSVQDLPPLPEPRSVSHLLDPDNDPAATRGKLDAPTAILKDGDQWILMVEYTFRDIVSWVEWDTHTKVLSVVQMGGGAAELMLDPDALETIFTEKVRRMLLVMGTEKENITHFVSVIVRD